MTTSNILKRSLKCLILFTGMLFGYLLFLPLVTVIIVYGVLSYILFGNYPEDLLYNDKLFLFPTYYFEKLGDYIYE